MSVGSPRRSSSPLRSRKTSPSRRSAAKAMCAGKRDASASARDRGRVVRGQEASDPDRRRARDPDPRERAGALPRDRPNHPPPRRHEPRLRSLAHDGDGLLRCDLDPQRVWKGAVIARGDDRRQRVEAAHERAAVEREHARAAERRDLVPDLPGHAGRCPANLDPVDREGRGLTGDGVGAAGDREQPDPDEQRSNGREGHPDAGTRERRGGGSHAGRFAAGVGAPTRRCRRAAGPRAGARRRTARARGGSPRA
jgi:hypothetical protein